MSDLVARIERIAEDVATLEGSRDEAERSAETYLMATQDDEYLRREITTLRDFIADVRFGVRDLDEYEAICGTVYL